MSEKRLAKNFTGLPMKALIGAPLKAATDANAMISRAQTQFLLSTCFEKVAENSSDLKPIMVTFKLSRQVLDTSGALQSDPITMDFSIPLMTLIPISSLAIETLKVSFSMEIKSSREFTKETQEDREKRSSNTGIGQTFHSHEFDTELHGTLSSKSKTTGNVKSGANYEVTMEAGQLPLPKGVTMMLDIFSKNLTPIPNKD
ncbi:DUF2589 domain-containing protein [Marinomonas mediterranea]|uniref:DUF2589 domain-containing protein n=1 Tax=Marinomonas mediterranea TaxID=119864 RepID=UPI00234B0B47|nr:DUF2589 domain-containing protein [Marinomonas mediterranea]WCN09842.1 DUF2589 domain-containing protein [Marinomonas mediterranea]WCN13926.1 DUF2589 domain-containing protein [Marinomonas mediterranea]